MHTNLTFFVALISLITLTYSSTVATNGMKATRSSKNVIDETDAATQDAGLLSNVKSMKQSSDATCIQVLNVWNKQPIRWQIINKGIAKLKQQQGVTYDNNCLNNRKEMKIKRVQGNMYNVTICCKPITCTNVYISSKKNIRWQIINQALSKLKQRRDFSTVFGEDCDQIKVFKIKSNRFRVNICCATVARLF